MYVVPVPSLDKGGGKVYVVTYNGVVTIVLTMPSDGLAVSYSFFCCAACNADAVL